MISSFFFVWFLFASAWTVNALRRPVPPGEGLAPLWLPGMVISELAPWYLVGRGLVAWGFLVLGAGESTIGQVGLVLFAVSEVGLLWLIWRSIRAARATGHSPAISTLFKIREQLPEGVQFEPQIHYWNGFTLDVMARPNLDEAPALIYVHPGSWMRGRPGRQARALFHRLSGAGWVVLDIRYPLSPRATFPEHLIGVKRAIAWAKSEGGRFGIDPARVAISGGSSGAHLAALAALTWDNEALQPGFERTDTRVMACMPFYGIYDLLVRNPTRYDWPFVARHVMKARPSEAQELYELGSPIDQARKDSPPFYVVHGELDSVVLPSESRHFVAVMEAAGADVSYHEVIGGQHGFDAFTSLRARAVANLCAVWLNAIALARSIDQ